MKNLLSRGFMLLSILLSTSLFVACGSDDNNSTDPPVQPTVSYKEILGTYIGTLHVYADPTGGGDYYNTEIIVSDAGNGNVRISPKADQSYSHITVKEIKIETANDYSVGGDDPEGMIYYVIGQNDLYVSTDKTKATDIEYTFNGSKK